MSTALALLFGGVQTVVVIATAGLAWVSIKKFRDSRGIDFILNAESAVDPLRFAAMSLPPEAIRSIYAHYDLTNLSDVECHAFAFMHSLYSHVSRMCYILTNDHLDLGLNESERAEVLDLWMKYLAFFKNHPAMVRFHLVSQTQRDYNERFLELAVKYLGDPNAVPPAAPSQRNS